MITQKQISNLHKLPLSDISLILDECIEALGLCDIKTSCEALGVQRSRIYQLMDENNVKNIGIHKFLMINILNDEKKN
jgi:predicted XRE-type DNA-binding protein